MLTPTHVGVTVFFLQAITHITVGHTHLVNEKKILARKKK